MRAAFGKTNTKALTHRIHECYAAMSAFHHRRASLWPPFVEQLLKVLPVTAMGHAFPGRRPEVRKQLQDPDCCTKLFSNEGHDLVLAQNETVMLKAETADEHMPARRLESLCHAF